MPRTKVGDAVLELSTSDRKLRRGMRTARRGAGRLQRRFNRVKTAVFSLQSAIIGIGSAIVLRGIKKLTDAFGVQQEAVIGLRSALIATGRDGVRGLRELTDEAARLQRLTTAADEALIKATSTLAQLAPSLNVQELREAQAAIVAIADTFLKGDVENAALLLGKTLGSTTNALTRYGLSITNTAAPASEKLAELLGSEVLAAAFQVSQDRATSFQGRMKQLSNTLGDLKEVFGGIIVDVFALTGRIGDSGGLIDQVSNLTAWVEANRAEWIRWGRVGLAAVNAILQSLFFLVRVAFNVGNIIGDLLVNTWKLATGEAENFRATLDSIFANFADMRDALESFEEAWAAVARVFGEEIQAAAEETANVLNRSVGDANEGAQKLGSTMNRIIDGLADVVLGFRKLANVIRDIGTMILREIVRNIIRATIAAEALQAALANIGGGVLEGIGSVLSGIIRGIGGLFSARAPASAAPQTLRTPGTITELTSARLRLDLTGIPEPTDFGIIATRPQVVRYVAALLDGVRDSGYRFDG